MNRILRLSFALLLVAATSWAAGPGPTIYASANVDGDPSEWDLTADFFANMYRAGDPAKALEAKLYVRYDCRDSTVYVLVLATPGIPALISGDPWIAIDDHTNKVVNKSSGDNGVPPDFAWVAPNFDGNADHAKGYEASFKLAPGTYEIFAHVNVFDSGASQTGALIGFPQDGLPFVLTCNPLATERTTWSSVKSLLIP